MNYFTTESFVNKFGELKGDINKRMPPEFKEVVMEFPIIAKKQYYAMAEREASLILSDNLIEEIFDYWNAAKPLNQYLLNCMKSN